MRAQLGRHVVQEDFGQVSVLVDRGLLPLRPEPVHASSSHLAIFSPLHFLCGLLRSWVFLGRLGCILICLEQFGLLCRRLFLLFAAAEKVRKIVRDGRFLHFIFGLFKIFLILLGTFVLLLLVRVTLVHQSECTLLCVVDIHALNDLLIVTIPSIAIFPRFLGNEIRLLEQIEKRVCGANEVRMIRVDQGGLDLYQVEDHLICRRQAIVEHALHHVVHPRLQLVIALQLR